jgi:DNA-binding NarL/FixJ family response regulator
MNSMAWSVLIVDDHEGFRAGARALREAEGFEVLGEAGDGESAVEQARSLRPQVVLLDVQLPGIDGFAVAEQLAAEPSAPAVVLISSRGEAAFRTRLAVTPARGFITKSEFTGECLLSLLG